MRWIETNAGELVNLEQVCGIYVAHCVFEDKPDRHNVVYLFPGESTMDEFFETEEEARERMSQIIDYLEEREEIM